MGLLARKPGMKIRGVEMCTQYPREMLERKDRMSWKLPMKSQAVAAALLGITLLVGTQAAAAKGCLKGAAVGAVAGHVAGHHAVLGAAAGCAIGHHMAKKKQQQQQQQQGQPKQQQPQALQRTMLG